VVDDDALIVLSYARVLSRVAEVLTASSVDEARALLAKRQVHLLLSDFMMPLETGDVLFMHARDAHPETRRVMMTAATADMVQHFLDEGLVHELVEKPAHIDELLQLVSRLAR
jgi:DNA-binding NtrC family response regulator